MKLEIIKTIYEYNKFESKNTNGLYIIKITETEFSDGEITIVKNGDEIKKLTHYTNGVVLEKNFTTVFQKELNRIFNNLKELGAQKK